MHRRLVNRFEPDLAVEPVVAEREELLVIRRQIGGHPPDQAVTNPWRDHGAALLRVLVLEKPARGGLGLMP